MRERDQHEEWRDPKDGTRQPQLLQEKCAAEAEPICWAHALIKCAGLATQALHLLIVLTVLFILLLFGYLATDTNPQ